MEEKYGSMELPKKKCGHEVGYRCCCHPNKRDFIEKPIDAVEEIHRKRRR